MREYSAPGKPAPWLVNNVAVPDTEQQQITVAKSSRVPPGKFFMVGDHRNNSKDGHIWGFVPRANIVGKAMCVFWPLIRASMIDSLSFQRCRTEAPSPVGNFTPAMR